MSTKSTGHSPKASESNPTFIQSRLEPSVLKKLKKVESITQQSFNKVYKIRKNVEKGIRRFYRPQKRRNSSLDEDEKGYSKETLQALGLVALDGDMEHTIDI